MNIYPTGRGIKCCLILLGSSCVIYMVSYYCCMKRGLLTDDTQSKDYQLPNTHNNYRGMHMFDFNACVVQCAIENRRIALGTPDILARYNCSHLMTMTRRPYGHLGNKMFQAASLIGIATWHGYTPVFPKKFRLQNTFELKNNIDFLPSNVQRVKEYACCENNDTFYNLDHSKNWTFSGYLQSWKYFKHAEERIRRAFTFKRKTRAKVMNFLGSIDKKGVENVCVHVRRGDFLKREQTSLGYTVAPTSYIERAMYFFIRRFNKVQFIFVSDGLSWCKSQFIYQNDTYFSPFRDPTLDMALMASCDHVIITSGSYGWWGAWLAGGITVYYVGFPYPGSLLDAKFNLTDYYPEHWIGMY